MFIFFKKQGARQYSLISYARGLTTSQIRKYFFKFAEMLSPSFRSNGDVPKKGKMLIISEADGLGDAILLRRMLEAIRENYDIYLITKQYHLPVYENVIKKEHIFVAESFLHFFKIVKKLKNENFDLLLLHSLTISSFIIIFYFFKRVVFKIGMFTNQANDFFNKNFNIADYNNVLNIYSDVTSYLGGKYKLYSFDEYKHPLIQKNNQVLVHIGSGSLCKNWRIKNFIELFKKFDSENIKYKIVGSKQDLELIKNFLNQFSIQPIAIGAFDELIKMILESDVVICHNTSVLHLSVALGVKTISFNSKSNYAWWNPYKDFPTKEHFAFKASDKECGYSQQIKSLLLEKKQCGCSLFDSITPSAVFAVTQKMLNQSSER